MIVSKRPVLTIDTLEKALVVIDAMREVKVVDGLSYLLSEQPELYRATHQHLSDILGVSREAITRAMKELRSKTNGACRRR